MRLAMGLCAASILLSTSACSKSTPSVTAGNREPAAAPAPAPNAAGQLGVVTGTVAANAIVLLEPKTPREFPAGEPVSMDQVSLTFAPEFLFVRTGQPVEFRNSDDTLHNVHVTNVDTREPSFNVAIPTGEKWAYTFKKDGFYHVGCDIHPAMSAEIFSASTPFVTRAESDGRFSFGDVPPGSYVVRVLASGANTERDVDIKAGGNNLII